MPLLRAEGLRRTFQGRGGNTIYAVDGVDLQIDSGEVLGLIGESGSGKSTVGRLVLRLLEADAGRVEFDGTDLLALPKRELRKRRSGFQAVFQEPYQSLNPRMTVGAIVEEPLIAMQQGLSSAERRARVLETIEEVGLGADHLGRRPRELSGGQQQRVGIARALVSEPRLIVLDEPTSSLDLTVRQSILRTLAALRQTHDLAYLFISHDIHTVRSFCTRTAVMYLGRIVEIGPTEDVLERPQHPYTKALLSAALSVAPSGEREHRPLAGDPPVPTRRPAGCSLSGRCPVELPECASTPVALQTLDSDRQVACLRATRSLAGGVS